MTIGKNWCFGQFYRSRIEVLKITKLLTFVIFVSVSLVRKKPERIERKFKTQNPNLGDSPSSSLEKSVLEKLSSEELSSEGLRLIEEISSAEECILDE